MADEGRWQPVGDPVPEGWGIGVVDKQRNVVWVSPPGWTPPPPDLNRPWPNRPANEVPRAKYRGDGTCESSGWLPGGVHVEAELPLVFVPMTYVRTIAELEAHVAPIRAALGG